MSESWKQWEGAVVDGKFRLQHYLGASDHSAVFATQSPDGSGQTAALKLVPVTTENLSIRQVSWERAAQLSHPHLLRVFATGHCQLGSGEYLYVVTENADENLAQILTQRALSPAEAGDMLPPILHALSYLQQNGLAHGALKPANIMAVQEQLKLSSDGLRAIGQTQPPSELAPYDAPELTKGEVSSAADVWSLGVTLQEVLTQRLPTSDGPTSDLAAEALPQPFAEVVQHCLVRDPRARWSLADIAHRVLAKPASAPAAPGRESDVSESVHETQEPRYQELLAQPRSANRLLRTAALFALALILIFAGSRLFHRSAPGKDDAAITSPTATSGEAKPPASEPTDRAGSHGGNNAGPSGNAASSMPSSQGAVLQRVDPAVSPGARATISGRVRVRLGLRVDAAGNVADVKVDSAGPSQYFARKAVEAARRWKFAPPVQNGLPVASQWMLHFEFARGGTHVSADRITP